MFKLKEKGFLRCVIIIIIITVIALNEKFGVALNHRHARLPERQSE
jgi:hypothetical protein